MFSKKHPVTSVPEQVRQALFSTFLTARKDMRRGLKSNVKSSMKGLRTGIKGGQALLHSAKATGISLQNPVALRDSSKPFLKIGLAVTAGLIGLTLYNRNWRAFGVVSGFFAALMEKLRESEVKEKVLEKLGTPEEQELARDTYPNPQTPVHTE